MNPRLEQVIAELQIINQLRKVAAILSWDRETYMPRNSAEARANQLALIIALAHTRLTGTDFRDALGNCMALDSGRVKEDNLSNREVRLLEEAWHDWRRATAVPVEFVAELARLTSEAQLVWQDARRDDNFGQFAPYLEKIIVMKRQEAEHLGYLNEPYDALLENYEPGFSTQNVVSLFADLRPQLIQLVQKIKTSGCADRSHILRQPFDEDVQWEFGLRILRDMGFDLSRGRQDRAAHPFTTDFHPTDVRLTTRLDPGDLATGLFGTIHEGGHGLYEQGLDERYFGTPLCEAISMGIHESQSRLWENYVARSKPFWTYYFPLLQGLFPEQLRSVSQDDFYAAVNTVAPSNIRVEADEITYNLHIMLRFDLERGLINGDIEVHDLPRLWNEAMDAYLGTAPVNSAEGVLQDIHWSLGIIGYFPTYTLGNLYGRQIYNTAREEIQGLEDRIAKGDLKTLREWLRIRIHRLGKEKTAYELIDDLTGSTLAATPFITYLEEKYYPLYGLN